MRILAISGSLRRDSHNTKLLRAAADLLGRLQPDIAPSAAAVLEAMNGG